MKFKVENERINSVYYRRKKQEVELTHTKIQCIYKESKFSVDTEIMDGFFEFFFFKTEWL